MSISSSSISGSSKQTRAALKGRAQSVADGGKLVVVVVNKRDPGSGLALEGEFVERQQGSCRV